MKDPTDLELIDHILGRSPTELKSQLDEALRDSAELRRRRDELAALWDLLAEVDTGAPRADLWPGLIEQLAERSRRPIRPISKPSTAWWAAASAAIVAAVLIGHGSARIRLQETNTASTVAVNESDVVTQLQLAAFDDGTLGELGESFVEDQTQGST